MLLDGAVKNVAGKNSCFKMMMNTVEPLYYGHKGDGNKCPHYRGVCFRELACIWILVSQGPSELLVIERCP